MDLDCFIFDFDGTLASSERAYLAAFDHTIRLHTGLEISEEEFRDYWNMTPQEVLRRYSEELLEEMLVSFEEHYYANHHHHVSPYDGVVEVLEGLGRLGAGVAVVSLKPRRAGERELELTGLRAMIDLTVWGDDVERPKPDPAGVLRVLGELGVQASRALVIGDSPADILMGRRAGARTAAALWSSSNKERLLAESPDLALTSPTQILSLESLESLDLSGESLDFTNRQSGQLRDKRTL